LIQLEKDWDKATANYEYIFIPNKPPVRRRHKNKWTDADEEEIVRQSKSQIFKNVLVLAE
jgi:hypothetical protein